MSKKTLLIIIILFSLSYSYKNEETNYKSPHNNKVSGNLVCKYGLDEKEMMSKLKQLYLINLDLIKTHFDTKSDKTLIEIKQQNQLLEQMINSGIYIPRGILISSRGTGPFYGVQGWAHKSYLNDSLWSYVSYSDSGFMKDNGHNSLLSVGLIYYLPFSIPNLYITGAYSRDYRISQSIDNFLSIFLGLNIPLFITEQVSIGIDLNLFFPFFNNYNYDTGSFGVYLKLDLENCWNSILKKPEPIP